MNKIFFFIIISILCSCNKNATAKHNPVVSQEKKQNFDWILGNWQRNNEKPDRQTYEFWNKKTGTEYIGIGFTLKENDTIWKEDIRLLKSDTHWSFEVIGEGELKPTIFKLSKIEKEGFICENQQNEFPKKIEYYKKSTKLKAIVSGEDMKIPFEFDRIKQD